MTAPTKSPIETIREWSDRIEALEKAMASVTTLAPWRAHHGDVLAPDGGATLTAWGPVDEAVAEWVAAARTELPRARRALMVVLDWIAEREDGRPPTRASQEGELRQTVAAILRCGHPSACLEGNSWNCRCCADIARAVEAEREACATLASTVHFWGDWLEGNVTETGDSIAAAIRARGSK